MIVPVMAISNLVLTRQIYFEETNGAHAHYREPVPLTYGLVLWGSCSNADLFDSLERLHCRVARIIFNLPKDMRSLDVLEQADWHLLSYSHKLVLLNFMHKAFHNELPQVLSNNIVMKCTTGYSTSARLSYCALFQLYLWQKLLSLIEAPYYGIL